MLAYRGQLQGIGHPVDRLVSLNLTDRRSLGYGLLIAAKFVARPDVVIEVGRRNLRRLREVHSEGSAYEYLDRWEVLLNGPLESLLRVLVSTDEASIALRHAAPFAGLLSEEERREVIRATRSAA